MDPENEAVEGSTVEAEWQPAMQAGVPALPDENLGASEPVMEVTDADLAVEDSDPSLEPSAQDSADETDIPEEMLARLRSRAARAADPRTPRKINLREHFSADAEAESVRVSEAQSARVAEGESEPKSVSVSAAEPAAVSADAAHTVAPVATARAVPAPQSRAAPVERIIGQLQATQPLEAALGSGARFMLIVGPPGCGKSAYLRELSNRGLGAFEEAVPGLAQLIDFNAASDRAPLELLESTLASGARPVVLAMRGTVPSMVALLQKNETSQPVYASGALVDATAGKLSLEMAERVDCAVAFAPLDATELELLAARALGARAGKVSLSPEGLQIVVKQALQSKRGAHELQALLRRLPAGEWAPKLKVSAPSKKAPAKAAKPLAKAKSKAKTKRR